MAMSKVANVKPPVVVGAVEVLAVVADAVVVAPAVVGAAVRVVPVVIVGEAPAAAVVFMTVISGDPVGILIFPGSQSK